MSQVEEAFNCKMCSKPDSYNDMVECEKCKRWFHYICAGVGNEIKNLDWSCQKCQEIDILKNKSIVPKSPSNVSQISHQSRKSVTLELEKLELEHNLEEQRIRTEKEYLEKRFYLLKKLEENDRVSNNGSEIDIVENVTNWLKPTSIENPNIPTNNLTAENKDVPKYLVGEIEHKNILKESAIQNQNVLPQVTGVNKFMFNYKQVAPKCSCINQNDFKQSLNRNRLDNPADDCTVQLTSQQLASRQVLTKELPYFNGQPEEWPLFISRYETSSRVCGFSNDENLIRLQKALKGEALEAVRNRLMLPTNVPNIINTLKRLYGRPEMILYTLIGKIRAEPQPKIDRLDTIIKYAIVVENLCATIEASNLTYHLTNPMLLQELIDKLPVQLKIDWARYMVNINSINISVFSYWLTQLAESLSLVTMNVPAIVPEIKKTERRLNKDKNFVYAHAEEATITNNKENLTNIKKIEIKKCCICNQTCTLIQNCMKFKKLNVYEKWKLVHKYNLCRTCLISHVGVKCNSNQQCGKNGCVFRHHILLHNDSKDKQPNQKQQLQGELIQQNQMSNNEYNCTTHQQHDNTILFRIIPVVLYGKKCNIDTFAFLDEGSSLTLIEQELADDLGLIGAVEPLCLRWTANTHRIEEQSQCVHLGISSINKSNSKYSISNARTVKSLNLPMQTLNSDELFAKYKYLKGLPIQSYNKAVPRILIGLDNSKLGATLKMRDGNQDEPVAVKTRLGWNIYGPLTKGITVENIHQFNGFHLCECERSGDEELQEIVKSYIALDSLGGVKSIPNLMSKEDERSKQIMEATTRKIDGRFETGLLWRYDNFRLPDSFPMAKRRLECLEKKMTHDHELAENIKKKISEYISKKYIHKLSTEELQVKQERVWYLPIFTVTNPNKPRKVRMVWDAAAKVNGVSLNCMLLKGPDQLVSLPAVLYRFRERKIAICGDIREMFHQIRIMPEDRHSQRFLWRDNPKEEPNIYVMNVMTFGASCSPSCAQYVKNKNANQFLKLYPRAVQSITENHYVDDLLESLDSEEEAIQLANQVKYIHQSGGFEIRNWISNSRNVVAALGEDLNQTEKDLNVDSEINTEKVLGMWWSTSSDSFTYSLKYNTTFKDILYGKRRPTKRQVLRILMKLYDPLGLIANFLIYLKIVLQDIWKSSIGWDDEINDEQYKKWLIWINVLPNIEKIKINRCYISKSSDDIKNIQCHIFVDASENAYAAIAYFRFEFDNEIECSLIGAKTRVAPIKMLSIPRLELQAALLGARLATSIECDHSIKINERYFWCDSKTVLCWLNSDQRKFKQFVAFRIGEILETTEVDEWRWISSKQNIADEATKWQKTPDFNKDSRWFSGPEFLRLPKDLWPNYDLKYATTNEEIKPHLQHDFIVLPSLVQVERFSKWLRLVRTVAYIYRFIDNIKRNTLEKLNGPISQPELTRAENHLYRQAQMEKFYDEVIILMKNKLVSDDKKLMIDKSSPIYKESPYIDSNGVLRVRGRIDVAIGVQNDVKRPILLPRGHHITQLIIRSFHQKYHHQNNETVVNEIRQVYAIARLRAAVKNECKHCQLCKNKRAIPRPPEMADLPVARLSSFTRPFSYIGIDYFGPMTVAFGRRQEKRWGVLITCLTTRAIHIEIAHTLSTDSCIICLRNFMARRGIPNEIYSDNGTNFHGADHEIQAAIKNINKNKLAEEFINSSTKWNFIPPASPHMGGSWERLIQSVKRILYQIMPTRNPTDEVLRNMLMEVENVVNSRPLTYIPIENENDEALTPNHFLVGSSNGIKPLGEFSDDHKVLRKNWMVSQNFANRFWKRWIVEYLPTLTRRTRWFHPVKQIEEGDIVIIVDEQASRNMWKKGKILKVLPGKDGQVRSAIVQTESGIYQRPAVKLAVLDVRVGKMGRTIMDEIDIPGGSVTAGGASDMQVAPDQQIA